MFQLTTASKNSGKNNSYILHCLNQSLVLDLEILLDNPFSLFGLSTEGKRNDFTLQLVQIIRNHCVKSVHIFILRMRTLFTQ